MKTKEQYNQDLHDALNLIREFIVQPYVAEDVDQTAIRARHVIKAVREEACDIAKHLLADFGIGPVACIIETPSGPEVKRGSVNLYFGVHTLEPSEIKINRTVIPLYK